MQVGQRACWMVAAALIACAPIAGQAASIEGIGFPDTRETRSLRLVLNGVGLQRFKLIFKAYVAGLYLGEGKAPERILDDVPKRLEIEYFHAIAAKDFAAITWRGIAANVSKGELESLRPRIEKLNAAYRDVEPGDRYALTYVPGVGTELSLDERPLGLIEGHDFARAVFSIWLGPNPIDASLKDALLTPR